jgi:YidC/Oxa1 family membrane protein insertase
MAATIGTYEDLDVDITYTILLPILQVFHDLTHSYGWAIILLTVLVRAIVWPLQTSSTRSMQRMSLLQPALKQLQEKYKDQPEVLSKKSMEFMSKNKMNPLGGCLPTLVQLPVLLALFATFTGPPFQDKDIPVKITLLKPDTKDAKIVQNPNSGGTSPYVADNGARAKFNVQPGDETLIWGREGSGQQTNQPNTIDFRVNALEGNPPANFKPLWKIATDPNGAKIDPSSGQAVFPHEGDILVAATFPGTNVQSIEVPIKVQPKPQGEGDGGPFNMFGGGKDAYVSKTESSLTQATVDVEGKPVTVSVTPGPSTVVAGRNGVVFELKPMNGASLNGLHPEWRILKDPNAATIDENGHATFPMPGEVTVAAAIPATAKHDRFYFVTSIGKVAKGAELFKPANWDVLGLLIAFAITMWISSQLMSPSSAASSTMDPDQAAIQKQTQQTMPIMVTAMFFFFALPAGVFLYLVVSNVLQTFQSWLIYRTPAPPLVDVTGDDDGGGPNGGGGGTVIDVGGTGGDGAGSTIQIPQKQGKKKKQS